MIFGYIFFGRHTETIMNCVSSMVAGDIKILADYLDTHGFNGRYKAIAHTMEIEVKIIPDANLLPHHKLKHNRIYRSLNKALLSKGVEHFFIKSLNRKLFVYIPSKKYKCVYKFTFLKKKIYSRTIPIVTLWGISSAIILLIIAFMFLQNQIRPIKRLAIAMNDFGNGIEHMQYKAEGATEVRAAWNAFLNMKTNFKKLIQERINTLAGISHDLKTPLTRMRLQIALMPETEETKGLLEDINIMTKITESFMLYASETSNETFSYQNLALFLEKIVQKHNFPIEISGDRSIEVFIKPISFERVMENIISNAEKYASRLYISFYALNNKIVVDMEDDGEGIAPMLLKNIFTPFVTGNKARTKQSQAPNVGLGLSIARDIMLDHGGEISAGNSEKYTGAKFRLLLKTI